VSPSFAECAQSTSRDSSTATCSRISLGSAREALLIRDFVPLDATDYAPLQALAPAIG
jgi:hypothetical protein